MNVLVFGSNRQGKHGAGAALHARRHYGAINGQASGFQGSSYAIITKELRATHPVVSLIDIKRGVEKFAEFVYQHPEMTFQVTAIGCGLAGFKPEQIVPLFEACELDDCKNVFLPREFERVLR